MLYKLSIKIKLYFFGLLFKKNSKEECHRMLLKNNDYYKSLSKINKKSFIIRTLVFLWQVRMESDAELNLDKEKKIIIASAFTQLTFGLNLFWFDNFNDFYITPRPYSYSHSNELYDGDVNLATKKVNMSWPAIEKGFKIPNDALNLCLHELGHCLFFENLKGSNSNRIFKRKDLKEWQQLAIKKINKIHLNENVVLRDYAATNFMEFFSVSLESFFEQTSNLKNNEPNLYFSMVKLLKQDPLKKSDPLN